jgi:hypothetical protein
VPNEIPLLLTEEVDEQSNARWGLSAAVFAAGLFLLWYVTLDPRGRNAPFWLWIMAFIFLLSGLSLLKKLGRKLAERRSFGSVVLRLDGPVQVGGRLSGTIEVGVPQRVEKLRMTLSCASIVWTMVTSKDIDGNVEKSPSSTERDLWEENGTLTPDADGALRIEVSLPPELPAFSYPGRFGEPDRIQFGRTYCRWRLQLRTYGETVNLRRTIYVPVSAASNANGAPRR